MSGALKKIGGALAFFAAFSAVRVGMEKYHEHAAAQHASEIVDQIQREGARKHPDETVSEAASQEGLERSRKLLGSEADAGKRRKIAAEQFYGFYFVNMRTRPEFCREQGVDISSFTSAFEREHLAQLTKARAVLANPDLSEDAYYRLVRAMLWKAGSQDMNDMATKSAVSLKGACELVAEHGNELAERLNIANVNPDLLKALMGDD
jgi:hypothetical protein